MEGFAFSEFREKENVDCAVDGEAGVAVDVSLNPDKGVEVVFTENVKGWDTAVVVVVVSKLSLEAVVDLEANHNN